MNEKWRIYFSIVFFLLYFLFVLIFYQERLFADSSFYLFNIINYENFFIPHFRYSNVLVQALPLIAVKLGLSVNIIAIIFSVSYALYYCLLHLIILRYGKSDLYLLIIPTLLVVSSSHLFFWIVSELQLSVGSSLTAFVVLYNKAKRRDIIWAAILLAVAGFFHPVSACLNLIVLPILLFSLNKNRMKDFLVVIGVLVLILMVKIFFLSSEYEQLIFQIDEEFFTFGYLVQLFYYLFYYKFLLLFFGGVLVYLLWKQRLKFLMSFFIGFIILLVFGVNLFFTAVYDSFYYDNLYLSVFFVMLVVLISMVDKVERLGNIVLYIFVPILIFSFVAIVHNSSIYRERVSYTLKCKIYAYREGIQKIVIGDDRIGSMMRNWSYPTESILYSALNRDLEEGNKVITVINRDIYEEVVNKYSIDSTMIILSLWNVITRDELNPKYFEMEVTEYKLCKMNELN